jgi:hypothetical protein
VPIEQPSCVGWHICDIEGRSSRNDHVLRNSSSKDDLHRITRNNEAVLDNSRNAPINAVLASLVTGAIHGLFSDFQ